MPQIQLRPYVSLIQPIFFLLPYLNSLFGIVSMFKDLIFTTTVIRSNHESYVYLLFLFSKKPYVNGLSQLHAGQRVISGPIHLTNNEDDNNGDENNKDNNHEGDGDTEDNNYKRHPLCQKIWFTLGWGTHYIRIKNQMYIIHRGTEGNHDIIRISVLGSVAPIRRLLHDARKMFFQYDKDRTPVFLGQELEGQPNWLPCQSKLVKTLDQAHIKDQSKKKIVEDMRRYLDSRHLYAKRGILYRRGYILHGPPGTGKTSLCLALAAHFNLPINVLNLEKLGERTLIQLMLQLQDKQCVILFEDIDCVWDTERRTASDTTTKKSEISMSTLLKLVDGSHAPEGHILMMTTNHPERLDPALTRAGRIDLNIVFERMGTEVARAMFCSFYSTEEE